MCKGWTPLVVDSEGNGLYERPDGARAFHDRTNPEERWIQSFDSEAEERWAAHVEEQERERAREAERDRWAREDDEWPWRRREKPSGLMYGVPAVEGGEEPAP